MQFMYSASPMNPNQVDEHFMPQTKAVGMSFYGYPATFSLEEDKVRYVREGQSIVYRGWMLDTPEYYRMKELVEAKGARLVTKPGQYLNTHHIPNWYPILRDFTPKTFVIDNMWLNHGCNLVDELKKLGWGKFFIKDFVKSLKTAGGSTVTTPEDAPKVVKLMEQYRGRIEGGLCIRQFEELHDELRYFIVNKHVWSPEIRKPDEFVLDMAAQHIDSPFFSVDVALDAKGEARIVEIGDGQRDLEVLA